MFLAQVGRVWLLGADKTGFASDRLDGLDSLTASTPPRAEVIMK